MYIGGRDKLFEKLKAEVLNANKQLPQSGLVTNTWGNVSGIDRQRRVVAIKPSGVDYMSITVDDIVLIDLDGKIIEGRLRPSSDAATHIAL